jgi:hypothetical protein
MAKTLNGQPFRHFISFQTVQDYERFVNDVDWADAGVYPVEFYPESDYHLAIFESARELTEEEQKETNHYSGILAESFNVEQ